MIPTDQLTRTPASAGHPHIRAFWLVALAGSFLISVLAIFRGGYIGPDYNRHLEHVVDVTRLFDFSMPDPPVYILINHGLFRLIGSNNGFPFAVAILQLSVNTLALWYWFIYSERRFISPVLHLAFVFFVTFLPVRMIHAVCQGTDWMTIPAFVLVLYVLDNVLSDKASRRRNATSLGLVLALGMWSKYSFVALIPAVFVILVLLWLRQYWTFQHFLTTCALSLVLPSALVFYSFYESTRVKDASARTVWLEKGAAPDMGFKDILQIKAADAELFNAPEYFKKDILVAHKHSYLGLSHMGIFTDTMNLFQHLTVHNRFGSPLIPDQKGRHAWKTQVMVASMSLGVIWTLFAFIGTPWVFYQALRNLWRTSMDREDSWILLGTAYFLLMFLPIPFVHGGAMFGYWTPRLILVPLLCFSLAAFLFIELKVVRGSKIMTLAVILLVTIQCALTIVMLA
jgi:hypothetical protein